MPVQTKEAWIKARYEWETSEDMSLHAVARALDVAVPTVSIRAKREGWTRIEPATLDMLDLSPKLIAEKAILRLYRLVTESKDEHVVLRAARELLDRTMGKAVEAPPLPPGELPDTPEMPSWMSPDRLAYQRASSTMPEAVEGPEAVDPALPPTPTQIAPPSPDSGPPRAPSDPPRHLQAVPKATPNWWDRPGVAATGPVREPDGRA